MREARHPTVSRIGHGYGMRAGEGADTERERESVVKFAFKPTRILADLPIGTNPHPSLPPSTISIRPPPYQTIPSSQDLEYPFPPRHTLQ